MEFKNLTRSEKIKYWSEIEKDIRQCLSLCGSEVPKELYEQLDEYLSHNELGIAIEVLIETAIEYQWSISKNAKEKILNTLEKMEYQKTDPSDFQRYENWLKII